jgi:Zn-dependent protease with chaperone function
MTEGKKKLSDISPRAWEHPADRAALSALKRMEGLNDVIQKVFGITSEKAIRLMFLASSIKVTGNQFPRISLLLRQVADTFDCAELPEVYVSQSPFLNAGAYGVDRPFIVVHSSLLSIADDEELSAVLAHELGHVMSGHVLYKTVLWVLTRASFSMIPLSRALLLPVFIALKEWDRKSEMTADRAGLLGVQSPDASYRLLMKLSGGAGIEQMDMNDFMLQAAEYERNNDVLDGVFRLLNTFTQSHPFSVVRLKELKKWAESPEYEAILKGAYPRRGEEAEDLKADFYRASAYYRERATSEDIVRGGITGLGEGVANVAEDVSNTVKGAVRGARKRWKEREADSK